MAASCPVPAQMSSNETASWLPIHHRRALGGPGSASLSGLAVKLRCHAHAPDGAGAAEGGVPPFPKETSMFEVKRLWWTGAVALVLAAGVAQAADEWETVESKKAVIKVRPRPSADGKEVWAEKDVEASAVDVQTALMDSASFRLWMPYVKESRVVSTNPDGSRVAYARLSLPVVDDRDYT